jgi:hypothetical protein
MHSVICSSEIFLEGSRSIPTFKSVLIPELVFGLSSVWLETLLIIFKYGTESLRLCHLINGPTSSTSGSYVFAYYLV